MPATILDGGRLTTKFADSSSVMSTPSTTGFVLAGATTYLKKVKRDKHREQSFETISEDRNSPRKVGLAPWHRHDSADSSMSASSSIRAFVMGKTPPATPLPPARYTSPSGERYQRGMSAPTFH